MEPGGDLGGAVFDAGFDGCVTRRGGLSRLHGSSRLSVCTVKAAASRRTPRLFARCAEGGDYGLLEGSAALQRFEDGELFPFEAAEIDGVVDAMNGEINGSGFESRDSGNFFALLALFHGVAGDFWRRIAANGEEEIVDGIVKIEEANVGLKAKTNLGRIRHFCGG